MFNDVECSMRLWEPAPEATDAAVCRHYKLLNEAISRHGGVRSRERGGSNSLVAAFICALDALAASLYVQRAFHSEDWPAEGFLGPRVAMYTAEVQRRDEDNYIGQAVNRCAQPRAAAHSGQVVLSQTTCDPVVDRLPEHAEFIDFGEARLRDLGAPEHAFGVVHPGLSGECSRWAR